MQESEEQRRFEFDQKFVPQFKQHQQQQQQSNRDADI